MVKTRTNRKLRFGFAKKTHRMLKYIGIVGFSKEENIFGLNPLIISTVFILFSSLLAHLARKMVKLMFGDSRNAFKQLLLEFIATLEMCATCYELIIVADNWGVGTYAIYLFSLTIWWGMNWEEASACPYSPLEEVLEGSKVLKEALTVILFQLIAAFLTFSYIQILWSMELVETHIGKAFEDCSADLQVDMITGAIIEAVATCMCRLVSRILNDSEATYGYILDAFFGTSMVVAAFSISGGYFNPALATSLKMGCEGHTFLEFMVVYWLGACLGSAASVFIYKTQLIQNIIMKLKKAKED